MIIKIFIFEFTQEYFSLHCGPEKQMLFSRTRMMPSCMKNGKGEETLNSWQNPSALRYIQNAQDPKIILKDVSIH